MSSSSPRIAIPVPTSNDPEYNADGWKQYAAAVEQAGGAPVMVPLDRSPDALAEIAVSCAGVLLPGSGSDVDPEKYGEQPIPECGPKDAAREAADDLLLQDAFNLHKPILGICYGLQSLNVWCNGSLIQDLPSALASAGRHKEGEDAEKRFPNHAAGRKVPEAHTVSLPPGSKLCEILAGSADLQEEPSGFRLSVNSSHHQAVRNPGDKLRIVAKSTEDGVIEALEESGDEQFVLGLQWHPERSCLESAASRAIFKAFVEAAAEWSLRAGSGTSEPVLSPSGERESQE